MYNQQYQIYSSVVKCNNSSQISMVNYIVTNTGSIYILSIVDIVTSVGDIYASTIINYKQCITNSIKYIAV